MTAWSPVCKSHCCLVQEVNDHVGFQPGVPVKPMLAKATTGISEARALPCCSPQNPVTLVFKPIFL